MNGSVISMGAIINFYIEGFGYNSVQTSILGATFVIVGVFSSMIFPILISKYNWFLISLRIIAIGAFLSCIITTFSLSSGSTTASLFSIGLLGFFLIPTLSVVYSFCTELTYPVSVSLFGCILQAGASLFGTVMTYAASSLVNSPDTKQQSNNNGSLKVSGLVIICLAVSATVTIWVRQDLRRINLAN